MSERLMAIIAEADWFGLAAFVTAIATGITTVIAAIVSLVKSSKANQVSVEARTQATSNQQQITSMQSQITAVALNTPPPQMPSLPMSRIAQQGEQPYE